MIGEDRFDDFLIFELIDSSSEHAAKRPKFENLNAHCQVVFVPIEADLRMIAA